MRRGQVALYLLMAIVALALLALMNVDMFLAVRTKNRIQNAGDAASLAAARCQGRLLNEIGRLNLEHLVAAVKGDVTRCAEIEFEQRRLALLGPVGALREANEAAKKNGMAVRDEFARILFEHAATVRSVYYGGGERGDPYPESWPGAWIAYAAEIEAVASEGLATGADNIEFYGAMEGHLLLNRNFYHAIAGRNWCWFHFNAESTLNSYRSFHDWAPLPAREEVSFENSEIFSLHLTAYRGCVTDRVPLERIAELLTGGDDRRVTREEVMNSCVLTNAAATWFFYSDDVWRHWREISPLAEDGYSNFPVVGEVKPEYDVRGAAAICRCVDETVSVANDTETRHTWSAAAKPFGRFLAADGTAEPVTAFGGLCLPAFDAVRLVPLDSVGGENLATADAAWIDHVRHHLGSYLEHGPQPSRCYYCRQLELWERESFRVTGINWLKFNAGTCVRSCPGGGPGGGGGGTSHGH